MTAARPRAVFFGSPAFAVPSLRVAAAETELCAVVSQPDRPAGRGQASSAPAVKLAAQALGVPIFQPEKVRTPETLATLAAFEAEGFIVVAYGRILPQALLDLPRLGPFNVHASLLPKLRGAAPIQWSIINGDRETGVSIMRMDAGMDTGPVYAMRATPIAAAETASELTGRLAALGADLLVEVLAGLEAGTVTAAPQDGAAATLAPRLRRDDGRVDWSEMGAAEVDRRVRALDPWPGVTAPLGGAEVRLLAGEPLARGDGAGPPGTVLRTDREVAEVATREGVYAVRRVQPPGRRPMDAAAYLRGRRAPSQ